MKLIDNFNLFKELLEFNDEDEFYFLQILVRGKDGHNANGSNKNRLVKYYTIKSIDDLCNKEEEIKKICDVLNARAYIHPTKRSFDKVANEVLRLTTDIYLSGKNSVGLKGTYSTACGKSYISSDKKYIIDLDGDAVNNIVDYVNFIDLWCDPIATNKFLYKVPTVNGIHLITLPFNTTKFKERFPDIDIHKNNPTLLYYKCLAG